MFLFVLLCNKNLVMIWYSKQSIDKKDVQSVVRVMRSDYLTQGNCIKKFEKKICSFTNSRYAVALSNASAALHIACLAINLKKGDILWTVPNTFVASASCALHCKAKVNFVDIDKYTQNIDLKKFEEKLILSKKNKSLPKVVVPVHFAGQPTPQKEIFKLSKRFGFKIIEDASHSLGARNGKEKVGSCKWSDMTIFSFHPVKPMTTAEGGVITTNNKKYREALGMLRNNGITKDHKKLKIKTSWYYEQQMLGFNYRMNEIQAALGLSQLSKLKKFNSFRNSVAKKYCKKLKLLPLNLPKIQKNYYSTYHLFCITLKLDKIKYSYDDIFKKLRKKGIGVVLHYLPVHLHPIFKKLGFKKGQYPVAENHAKTALSLPMFYGITDSQIEYVVKNLKKILLSKN